MKIVFSVLEKVIVVRCGVVSVHLLVCVVECRVKEEGKV